MKMSSMKNKRLQTLGDVQLTSDISVIQLTRPFKNFTRHKDINNMLIVLLIYVFVQVH